MCNRFLVMLFLIASLAPGLAACNTVEGVGKDVEAGGEAMSDAASDTKEDLND